MLVHSYILDELERAVAHESLLQHLVEFLLDLVMQVPLLASILSALLRNYPVILGGLRSIRQLGLAVQAKRPAV